MSSVHELMEQADRMGVRVVETRLPSGILGFYSDMRSLILVDGRLNARQCRCALQHELVHAEHHDRSCQGTDGGRVERRTRSETARRLISPVDYALAEAVHEDGDPRALALELDVTVQVVQDYQRLLDGVAVGRGLLPVGLSWGYH